MNDYTTYDVSYTEAIARDAVRTYVWRRGFAGLKGLWAIEILMLALLIWLVFSKGGAWQICIVGFATVLPPCLIMLIWIAHHRNTVGKFHDMADKRARFTLRDEDIDISSGLGGAQIPWSRISEIWERPAYWMIFTGKSQFFTLPIDTISAADRDFIRTKVRPVAP